ncbi:MAG TPA: tape measure protein [Azospirillum sp.]|nr:tape measure protein [Azospirillum sp.]
MADQKLALLLTADASGLVGEVGRTRETLERLKETANDAGRSLSGVTENVTTLAAKRGAARGLGEDMGFASSRAQVLHDAVLAGAAAHRNAAADLGQHAGAMLGWNRAAGAVNDNAASLFERVDALTVGFRGLMAVVAADRLIAFGKAAVTAAAEAEQFDRRLKGLVGSGTAFGETQLWLSNTANALGTSVREMGDGYARFLTLAKGGLLTVQQARDLTVGLKDAQAHFAADAGRMGDVMYGLGQALASPIVHMEELNQVVEPLPGLLLDLDKAAGLPAGGFRRLINEGKVTSEVFRDTLVKALKGYSGEAAAAAQGVEGAWARLENARKKFLAEVGKPALPGTTSAADYGAGALNLGTRFLQWSNNGQAGAARLFESQRFDELLAERDAKEKELARYRAGAGGVYASRNAKAAEADLARINRELDEVTRRWNALDQVVVTSSDGWAEMWGVTGDGLGTVASAAAKLAIPFAELAKELDLLPGKTGLLTASQAALAQGMGLLTKVAALPPEELKKLGVTAADIAMMMDRLREKIDPVTAAIKALNDTTAALSVPDGWRRELYQTLEKAAEEKGRPLTDDEAADLTAATRRNQSARGADRVAQLDLEAKATERLAQARASGSQAAVVAAQAENAYDQELAKSGDKEQAKAARAAVLKSGMAELSGEIGAQANVTSRSARQMLALADAYAQGADAVAAQELANRIETETAKSGAGAHSALARALKEEDAARRALAAAQWTRDMDLQIAAAKALALAERDGAKAVTEATVKNAAAAQAEREGVRLDSERGKAIAAKTAELARWQAQQNYEAASKAKDDELKLAELELSLQGQSAEVREHILALARAELEIRRQNPQATEEEVKALLRKEDTILRTQRSIGEQRALWDELARIGERAFDRIGSAITQAFVEGKGSAITFGSVAKAVLSELVQAALQLAVINPMKNWMTGGSSPSLWSMFSSGASAASNIAGQAQAAGQGGMFSTVSNGLSAASGAYSIYNGASTLGNAANWFATSSLGQQAGLSTVYVDVIGDTAIANTPMLTTSGESFVGGAASFGQVLAPAAIGGAGGAMIGTALNSKLAGGLAGAAIGGLSAYAATQMGLLSLGPYGWAAAAVLAAVMAVLGTQKETVGPISAGRMGIDDGKASLKSWGTDNEGSDENAKALGNAAAELFNGLLDIGSGRLDKAAKDYGLVISHFAKDGKFYSELDNQKSAGFDTAEEAVIDGVRRFQAKLVQAGKLAFEDDNVTKALKMSTAKTVEEFTKDLGAAATWTNVKKITREGYNPFDDQIKQWTTSAKEMGTTMQETYVDLLTRVTKLGLDTKENALPLLQKSFETELGLRTPDYRPLTGVAGVTKQAEIALEGLRSTLTALEYTAEAQADFSRRYVAAAVNAFEEGIQTVDRRATRSLRAKYDPTFRSTAADVLDELGLKAGEFPALTASLDGFFDKARSGKGTLDDLIGAKDELIRRLRNGRITADQFSSILGLLTQSFEDGRAAALAMESTLNASRARTARTLRGDGVVTVDELYSGTGLNRDAFPETTRRLRLLFGALAAGIQDVSLLNRAIEGLEANLRNGRITTEQFNTLYSEAIDRWDRTGLAASEAAATAQSAMEELASFARSTGADIQRYRDGLKTGNDGAAGYDERLKAAREQFVSQLSLIATSSDPTTVQEALRQITQYAETYRKLAQEGQASGLDYKGVEDFIDAALGGLPMVKSEAQRQTDALNAMPQLLAAALNAEGAPLSEIEKQTGISGPLAKQVPLGTLFEGIFGTGGGYLREMVEALRSIDAKTGTGGTGTGGTGTGGGSTTPQPEGTVLDGGKASQVASASGGPLTWTIQNMYGGSFSSYLSNDLVQSKLHLNGILDQFEQQFGAAGIQWSEERYLRLNPDVAQALGGYPTGRGLEHYLRSGFFEGRRFAQGGKVPSTFPGAVSGLDSVRALLMPEERVLSVEQSRLIERLAESHGGPAVISVDTAAIARGLGEIRDRLDQLMQVVAGTGGAVKDAVGAVVDAVDELREEVTGDGEPVLMRAAGGH